MSIHDSLEMGVERPSSAAELRVGFRQGVSVRTIVCISVSHLYHRRRVSSLVRCRRAPNCLAEPSVALNTKLLLSHPIFLGPNSELARLVIYSYPCCLAAS